MGYVNELKKRALSGDKEAILLLEKSAMRGNENIQKWLESIGIANISNEERVAYLAELEANNNECPKCKSRNTGSKSSTTGSVVNGACQLVGRAGGFWGGVVGSLAGMAAEAIFDKIYFCNKCKYEWRLNLQNQI